MICLRRKYSFAGLIILVLFSAGCATSSVYHTQQETDEQLMSHFYDANFDKVINGCVEAAASVTNWKVDNVDQEKRQVTVLDQTTWGTYIRRIEIKKVSEKRMRVDVLTYAAPGGTYRGLDKDQLTLFYKKLDGLIR